jgi:hypothetical protein
LLRRCAAGNLAGMKHRTVSRFLVAAAVASLCLAGCPTQKELAKMPTLSQVRPLGPKGQECYDFCAQAEVACKDMCPGGTHGDCPDDCVRDTKMCLKDCPEMQRPVVKDDD